MERNGTHTSWTGRAGTAGVVALGGIALTAGVALTTYPKWRPWCVHWGATADEAVGALPGDELLVEPDLITTRSVSIASCRLAARFPAGL